MGCKEVNKDEDLEAITRARVESMECCKPQWRAHREKRVHCKGNPGGTNTEGTNNGTQPREHSDQESSAAVASQSQFSPPCLAMGLGTLATWRQIVLGKKSHMFLPVDLSCCELKSHCRL